MQGEKSGDAAAKAERGRERVQPHTEQPRKQIHGRRARSKEREEREDRRKERQSGGDKEEEGRQQESLMAKEHHQHCGPNHRKGVCRRAERPSSTGQNGQAKHKVRGPRSGEVRRNRVP